MTMTSPFVYPRLERGHSVLRGLESDEELFRITGLRLAFTTRHSGVSMRPFSSLNLASHVGDEWVLVQQNRRLLCQSLGADFERLIVPHQVHGARLGVLLPSDLNPEDYLASLKAVCVASKYDFHHLDIFASNDAAEVRRCVQEGCDGLLVGQAQIPALLCFADCMSVIIVSSSGFFAVVHAGWRGVMARIAVSALYALQALDKSLDKPGMLCDYNVYIGPHIHACCFEVGDDLAHQFKSAFGDHVLLPGNKVDLLTCQKDALKSCGIDPRRICVSAHCTQCEVEDYFSYRAEQGRCGRHGAFCFLDRK